jgi:hypothetical protein
VSLNLLKPKTNTKCGPIWRAIQGEH